MRAASMASPESLAIAAYASAAPHYGVDPGSDSLRYYTSTLR
jgi:hypothetical protein